MPLILFGRNPVGHFLCKNDLSNYRNLHTSWEEHSRLPAISYPKFKHRSEECQIKTKVKKNLGRMQWSKFGYF
jgi:hypothetical protein